MIQFITVQPLQQAPIAIEAKKHIPLSISGTDIKMDQREARSDEQRKIRKIERTTNERKKLNLHLFSLPAFLRGRDSIVFCHF